MILKNKNEAFSKFKQWKVLVEKQTGRKVKRLRTDNGLEFCAGEFQKYCADEGIARHKTVAGTPQQNGLVERFNITLLERTRCMLISAKLPKVIWAEAVTTAAYLLNMHPSTALSFKTPEEIWSGKLANYSRLRVFGCCAYAHVKQGKLEPRALKCIFLGYPKGIKGYKLWCLEPGMRKCIINRDVIFNENVMGYTGEQRANKSCELESVKSSENKKLQLKVESQEVVQGEVDQEQMSSDWSTQETSTASS